mgnify:CR=1 FL=1
MIFAVTQLMITIPPELTGLVEFGAMMGIGITAGSLGLL